MVSSESTRSLVVVNAATLLVALGLGWPVQALMWPYWIQSVVIGYYSRRRILALGRFSTALDIANACLYLASDESAMVSGACIEVDGARCV